eukprot:14626180-Alexandrium_andersonii.AAC.1
MARWPGGPVARCKNSPLVVLLVATAEIHLLACLANTAAVSAVCACTCRTCLCAVARCLTRLLALLLPIEPA